jgi:hydrogenase-4 component B
MNEALHAAALLLALALPLGLAALWPVPRLRSVVGRLTPWAPAPALLLALFGTPGPSLHLEWLLLGTTLGLTETTRVFLLFTALLWLGAGIYARGYLRDDPLRPRFELAWLLTLTGNLGLILALDVATFYASFALMTFAAYVLVIHTGKPEARRAGRVYLAMAVLGEGLILAGLLLAAGLTDAPLLPLLAELPAAIAQSAHRNLIMALLWLGFGVKAGLPLLHLWLPLAHPVAPVPASAVLSGAMIKAGLLGWLHTLPLGVLSLPGWSVLVMAAGFTAAFGAAFLALHQQQPKTVLAYSSISQMGLITVGVGAGLQAPALWPLLAPAIVLFALHHALAKGALFLGVGIARHPGALARPLLWVLLTLPALALTGLMTSGSIAKLELKAALAAEPDLPGAWEHLPLLLALAAVGTTLIMARYLWLLRREDKGDRAPDSMWWGWSLVLGRQPGPGVSPSRCRPRGTRQHPPRRHPRSRLAGARRRRARGHRRTLAPPLAHPPGRPARADHSPPGDQNTHPNHSGAGARFHPRPTGPGTPANLARPRRLPPSGPPLAARGRAGLRGAAGAPAGRYVAVTPVPLGVSSRTAVNRTGSVLVSHRLGSVLAL